VTVCIAAICQEAGEPRIVLCSDTRLDYDFLGSTDVTVKTNSCAHGWIGLLAGNWAQTLSLFGNIKSNMMARPAPATNEQVLEAAKVAAEEFTKSAVCNKDTTCDILLSGFLGGVPAILRLSVAEDRNLSLSMEYGFSVIGQAATVASVFLMERQCGPRDPIQRTAYCVYEAKRYAERLGSVGRETHMTFQAPPPPGMDIGNANVMFVNETGLKKLERAYRRFGLKPVKDLPPLSSDCFSWPRP
jgi:hypothetical protein